MFDPRTLATLATFALPPRQSLPADSVFQDFTGGGYFYLDARDRVVTATTTRHILVIADTGTGFTQVADYDLSGVLTSSEEITSALPDSNGLLWFVAKTDGVVGTLNLATGAVHVMRLGHGSVGEIENSFATDARGGVYIASDRQIYRFAARTRRRAEDHLVGALPQQRQDQARPGRRRHRHDADGDAGRLREHHRQRRSDGRRRLPDGRPLRDGPRLVCKVPVFARARATPRTRSSWRGRSMIVENNYGYTGPTSVENGA